MIQRLNQKNLIIFLYVALMLLAGVTGELLKPEKLLKDVLGPVLLNEMIPNQVADWREVVEHRSNVINPQLSDTLSRTYDQILTKTYTNQNRDVLMLSIAYGENQIDDGALHLPEICYPAQGLVISHQPKVTSLSTNAGNIILKQFVATQSGRVESVSYWTMMGLHHVIDPFNTKLHQIGYGLKGVIPDGMIFRVSVIDADTKHAFFVQEDFLRKLLSSLSPQDRQRLTGLGVN